MMTANIQSISSIDYIGTHREATGDWTHQYIQLNTSLPIKKYSKNKIDRKGAHTFGEPHCISRCSICCVSNWKSTTLHNSKQVETYHRFHRIISICGCEFSSLN